MKEEYCIPPQANAAFICNMEDVLAGYTQPYEANRPQVGMDETRKQLLTDMQELLPMQPSHPQRVDYEYRWGGLICLCSLSF